MKYLLLITLGIVCLACSSPKLEFEKASGKVNEFKKGDAFHINLPEDHSTGYMWSVQPGYDNTIVQYIKSVYHSTEKGSVDFNFEALSPGRTEISVFLRMHTDTTDMKTYVIDVK